MLGRRTDSSGREIATNRQRTMYATTRATATVAATAPVEPEPDLAVEAGVVTSTASTASTAGASCPTPQRTRERGCAPPSGRIAA
ncbi:hypothetical protein DLJ96_16320 [Actinotalea fermentans ATCC 43279 = JCM 9966 = DSM 3133]|nr:hypothetical protein DLJ96_16320 [Actinotalea fermentans ATCC 43279 = JCM 9966 = DSM 3133]